MKVINFIGGTLLLVVMVYLGFSSIEKVIDNIVVAAFTGILIEMAFVGGLLSIVFSKAKNQKPNKLAVIAFWFGNVANGFAFALVPEKMPLLGVFVGVFIVNACWFTEYLLSFVFGENGGGDG